MKPLKSKTTKNLIIILAITAILSGFLPNYVYAVTDTANGGGILEPIEQFVVFLCDNVMEWLQNKLTSSEGIEQKNGEYEYNFRYSPAIIFSGDVQALDINFIKPNTDTRNSMNQEAFLRSKVDEYYDKSTRYDYDTLYTDIYEKSQKLINEENYKVIEDKKGTAILYEIYYLEKDNVLYVTCIFYFATDSMDGAMYETTYPLTEDFYNEANEAATYDSTASKLQGTIATWYNALRRIALVGLLSVLVYVGIRIVLTSSSQDKAKYKNMLKDWLVALCLLFTLHYIMSATLVIVNEISDIFSMGETDPLLNKLRTQILDETWGTVLAQVIMYVTIVIFTITFTIQYMMRVIYMAFYTLIAPLITLTYPLDKIKDGQAQAFSMWIREYIFTALVQVIHLVIYSVLVSSALSLVDAYPLFAIIAMAFIKKAEGIIKKMFGFDKSETVGTLGAAATGALVVNAMKQVKGLGGKKGKSGGKAGGESGSGGSTSGNVRTATNNPLGALQGNAGGRTTNANSSETEGEKEQSKFANKMKDFANKPGIKGAKSVGKKYFGPAAKGVLGAGLGVGAGLTGAMIGFAAGVAQGDVGAALTGAAVGGTAGMNLGKGAVNLPGNIGKGIKSGWNNLKDTYREGEYGEERYKAIKTVAQNCPDEIYNNKEMLEEFWRKTMGEEESAENIKEILRKFK